MQTTQRRIRTLVVDDSPIAVHSICAVLERQPEVEVVGTAQDGREALSLAQALRAELVLMDVQMPIMNGIEAARELSGKCPAIRVVMVTIHDRPELRGVCRESGAKGFILKQQLHQELPTLLRQLFGPGSGRHGAPRKNGGS